MSSKSIKVLKFILGNYAYIYCISFLNILL